MWVQMVKYAEEKGWKPGDYKKLNLPFENKLMSQSAEIRERMAKRVEDFVFNILVNVFNAKDTAPLALDAVIKSGSYVVPPKGKKIESPADWSPAKIAEKAAALDSDKGPAGNFED